MSKYFISFFLTLAVAAPARAQAGCEVIDGTRKAPFDGNDLKGLQIEKKSLILLNKEFPLLNVIEKIFKGEAQTCTPCTEKYITCTDEK